MAYDASMYESIGNYRASKGVVSKQDLCMGPISISYSQQQHANGMVGDRFIPDRRSMEIEASQYFLTCQKQVKEDGYFNRDEYLKVLAKSLFSKESTTNLLVQCESEVANESMQIARTNNVHQMPNEMKKGSVLSFCNTEMPVVDANLKVLDVSSNAYQSRRVPQCRTISSTAERVLDAPDLINDFYLNLLDWSAKNIIAVALGSSVYLWNASSGEIVEFCSLSDDDYVSSLQYSQDGRHIAIGSSRGDIDLWDVEHHRKLRSMTGHQSRVVSLSWNDHLISSGSRDSNIFNHDVRLLRHHISTFSSHCNEVCGLRWSPDGTLLASGGNDNALYIWSLHSTRPVHAFLQHKAAVKSLGWCPWQTNLLASGGGSSDRTIKFWNTSIGTCLNSINAGSQVCSLVWSKHLKELISSHGFSQNQIVVWKFPSMTKQASLIGHTSRVLHMSLNPSGTTVVSAAADETLRIWKIFDPCSSTPSSYSPPLRGHKSLCIGTIR